MPYHWEQQDGSSLSSKKEEPISKGSPLASLTSRETRDGSLRSENTNTQKQLQP